MQSHVGLEVNVTRLSLWNIYGSVFLIRRWVNPSGFYSRTPNLWHLQHLERELKVLLCSEMDIKTIQPSVFPPRPSEFPECHSWDYYYYSPMPFTCARINMKLNVGFFFLLTIAFHLDSPTCPLSFLFFLFLKRISSQNQEEFGESRFLSFTPKESDCFRVELVTEHLHDVCFFLKLWGGLTLSLSAELVDTDMLLWCMYFSLLSGPRAERL